MEQLQLYTQFLGQATYSCYGICWKVVEIGYIWTDPFSNSIYEKEATKYAENLRKGLERAQYISKVYDAPKYVCAQFQED